MRPATTSTPPAGWSARSMRSRRSAPGQIDHAITVLRFEQGSLGTIDNTLASGYGFDCRCEIVGSEGAIRIDSPHSSNLEWLKSGTGGFERTRTFLDRFTDSYPRELQSFVHAIQRRSDVPVSGEDGLAAVVLATPRNAARATRYSSPELPPRRRSPGPRASGETAAVEGGAPAAGVPKGFGTKRDAWSRNFRNPSEALARGGPHETSRIGTHLPGPPARPPSSAAAGSIDAGD